MTPTRRLAAIMAADVAGFSAAMERDEEGTFAQVQELRGKVIEPKIAEHTGRLVKTTGDGFLAEFASPIAAMRCALAIQAETASTALKLRIGLNLGDVIVEANGDVYGEGVNVAARLEALADPGGILISAKVHSEVEGKVEAAFEDRGEQQVKNIARPVRAYAARLAERTTSAMTSAVNADVKPLPLPDKPSIAVLPFQNMSGDPEQEYFADGMVEDIITAMSRFKSLFVIARNSSFTYKGKAVDIKQVGRELGVRYVLEGSVRKAGGRVRITGQLIEATSGSHLWAEKYDGALTDVFDLQDQLTSSVVGAILPAVQRAEIERMKLKRPADLDAYDWYLRGTALTNAFQPRAALPCYRTAISKDERYADAHAMVGASYIAFRALEGDPLISDEVEEALAHANNAARLGSDNAFALAHAARILVFLNNEYDRGVAMVEQALNLNSNLSTVWIMRGWINILSGNADQAIESFSQFLRISPVDPLRSGACNGMAWGHFMLGQYEDSYKWATRGLAVRNTPTLTALGTIVASAVWCGRLDQANDAARELRQITPEFRIANTHEVFRTRRAEVQERIRHAFRTVRIPE